MSDWVLLATSWPVVRRACGYAVVVGTILVAINHGDAVLAGNVSAARLLRIGLTVMVPYLVSTFSSVGATLEAERRLRGASASR